LWLAGGARYMAAAAELLYVRQNAAARHWTAARATNVDSVTKVKAITSRSAQVWFGSDWAPFSDRTLRGVLTGYLTLAAVPFVYAAFHARFYRNTAELGATILEVSVLLALVRHRRWAWVLLIVFHSIGIVSLAWGNHSTPSLIAVNSVALVLLLSRPMRYYVENRPALGRRTESER
jgi:hypothetical protein